MKIIKKFPNFGKSNPNKYPKLRNLKIPDQQSLAVIDLNIINKYHHLRAKDIAYKASQLIYPMLSKEIQRNTNRLNTIHKEPYLHNEARFGLKHLRDYGLATNKDNQYTATKLGKRIFKTTNNYCEQYNQISKLPKNEKRLSSKKEQNQNKYLVTQDSRPIYRKQSSRHLSENRKQNANNPVKKVKSEVKDGNNGEDSMKEHLVSLYGSNKNYIIKYESPHLNNKNPNDAFGCDAYVKNIKNNNIIYIDAKKTSSKSFQFYMSINEIARLTQAAHNKHQKYCIYLFNQKRPYLHIYRTGDPNNGLNDSKGQPYIKINHNNIFQIDRYKVLPVKG